MRLLERIDGKAQIARGGGVACSVISDLVLIHGATWLPGSVSWSHSCEDVSDGGPERVGLSTSGSSAGSSRFFSSL